MLYTTFVRPHLEYASVVWNPYNKQDIKVLESVQRRATKLCPELRGLRYEDRLDKLGLTTLVDRRERGDAIQMYKIVHGRNAIDWYHPILTSNPVLSGPASNLRRNGMLVRQLTSIRQREFFFNNRIVGLWNGLPDYVKKSESVNGFKNNYDKHKQSSLGTTIAGE